MLQNYKYLQFAPFQSMTEWGVTHLLNRGLGFTNQYPFVRICDVIQRSAILVTIKDEVRYKQITLKTNGGGAVLRGVKLGKDIKTKKQYLAKEGQFIMSKIDARNGAFGVVTKDLDGAVVTADFPLFDVNTEKISPEYLSLLSATKPFVEYAQSCSSGTTNRQRIDIDSFLAQQIPLPSLEEQNDIISKYNKAHKQADECVERAKDVGKQIEAYLENKLGLKSPVSQHLVGKLYFVQRSKILRWDVWNVAIFNYAGLYPLRPLQDIIEIQSGKFLPTKNQSGGEYNVYGGNGLIGTHDQYCYSGKRIVIGRVGEYCGNVHLIDGKYWITDNALKVDKISDEVTWEYLKVALSALNINQYKSKSAQPSISQTKIMQLQIPVPNAKIQNEIVTSIDAMHDEQTIFQKQAFELRVQANKQFEQKIYNKVICFA